MKCISGDDRIGSCKLYIYLPASKTDGMIVALLVGCAIFVISHTSWGYTGVTKELDTVGTGGPATL